MTMNDTSALDAARTDLSRRLNDLDALAEAGADNWAERSIVGPLFDVADMVCRIGDHPNDHYRASKSTPLVNAAHAVRLAAFAVQVDEKVEEQLRDVARAERAVCDAVGSLLWGITRGDLTKSQVAELRQAIAQLNGIVQLFEPIAVDDPAD